MLWVLDGVHVLQPGVVLVVSLAMRLHRHEE